MGITLATEEDAESISKIAIEAVKPHKDEDFNNEGWKRFINSNDVASTRQRLLDEQYFTLCYRKNAEILGLITIFNNDKIHQLFVLPKAMNSGIAKNLWRQAKNICINNGNPGNFWVRSSALAVPIYQKFGFAIIGDREVSKGIAFQLMRIHGANER
jgi:GNAT superfamily N-acetyltransferase